MSSLVDKHGQHCVRKKEREARRDRYRLEQEKVVKIREDCLRRDHFLETLNRKSIDEAGFTQRIWQLKREADVITENRELRENQYATCRQGDWEECVRREKEKWRLCTPFSNHFEQNTVADPNTYL